MVYKTRIRTRKHNKKYKIQMGGENEVIENNVPPTLKNNLKKFLDIFVQIFNNMSMYTLDKVEDKITDVSKSFGIDPNKSIGDEFAKIGKKTEQLNNVLDSPEGKKTLSNLTEFFNRITKTVIIPSSEKLTEELIEQLQPILIRGQNAIFALLSASPFGALIDIPRFLSESLGVVEKSVTLADNVLDIGVDTVDKMNEEKDNFNGIVSDFGSLMEKANTELSSGLDSVKNRVDDYGKNMMEKEISNINNYNNENGKNMMIHQGGMSNIHNYNNILTKYQNQSNLIGGRINKAYSEFVTSPQIIQQYGETKKRRIKRNRLQSRRHK